MNSYIGHLNFLEVDQVLPFLVRFRSRLPFPWTLWETRKTFPHCVGQEKPTTHPTECQGKPFPALT